MPELLDLMSEDRQGVRSDKFWKIEITERVIPGKRGDHRSRNKRLYTKVSRYLCCRLTVEVCIIKH